MQSSSMLDKMQAFNTFLIYEGVKKYVICCQYIWHIQQTKIKNMDFFSHSSIHKKKVWKKKTSSFLFTLISHIHYIAIFFFPLLLIVPHSLPSSFIFNTGKCIGIGEE